MATDGEAARLIFSLEKVSATEEEEEKGEEGNFCAGGEMRLYITRIGSGGVFLGQTERVFHIFFSAPTPDILSLSLDLS